MAFLSIVLSIPSLGRRNVYIYMMINKQLSAKNHVFLINFIKTGSTGILFLPAIRQGRFLFFLL